MSDTTTVTGTPILDRPPRLDELIGPPATGFVVLTSIQNTAIYIRQAGVTAYGEAPAGYAGNSWIYADGNMWYVMQTADQLSSILS